jgi:hypothetical protein
MGNSTQIDLEFQFSDELTLRCDLPLSNFRQQLLEGRPLINRSATARHTAAAQRAASDRPGAPRALPWNDSAKCRLPAPTPTPSAAAYETQDQEQYHGSNERIDDQGDYAGTQVNAEPWQQPVTYECTD